MSPSNSFPQGLGRYAEEEAGLSEPEGKDGSKEMMSSRYNRTVWQKEQTGPAQVQARWSPSAERDMT